MSSSSSSGTPVESALQLTDGSGATTGFSGPVGGFYAALGQYFNGLRQLGPSEWAESPNKVAWVTREMRVNNVLDLTDASVRQQLGVTLEQLTGNDYTRVRSANPIAVADDVFRVGEFQYTRTAGNHALDLVAKGDFAGEFARPYLKSPLTIQEIMATRAGVPDPGGVPGALRFDVPGAFRGSEGAWELVVHPETKMIYHFNFTTGAP